LVLAPQSTPLHEGMHIGGSTQLPLLAPPQILPAAQQVAPHCFRGAGQVHAPLLQELPGPQALLQDPQFPTSEAKSTQLLPQRLGVPPEHCRVQVPLTQVWPPVQTLPAPAHRPQWLGSVLRFTHRPAQLVCPSGQQIPPAQVPPVPQVPPSRSTQVKLLAAVQALQAPAQPVAQHLPATQNFDAQSELPTQSPPRPALAGGVQSPSMQTRPPPQAAVLVWQAPLALQVRVVWLVLEAQSD
jgi:hypothetical protein